MRAFPTLPCRYLSVFHFVSTADRMLIFTTSRNLRTFCSTLPCLYIILSFAFHIHRQPVAIFMTSIKDRCFTPLCSAVLIVCIVCIQGQLVAIFMTLVNRWTCCPTLAYHTYRVCFMISINRWTFSLSQLVTMFRDINPQVGLLPHSTLSHLTCLILCASIADLLPCFMISVNWWTLCPTQP